jgi:K+-sensing histidine kinase KdpD
VIGRSRLQGYGAAIVLLIVVIALRWLVIPEWSLSHPYLLFYPAIIVSGWYGGFGPGILATLLTALALTYLWMSPLYSMRIRDVQDVATVLLFIAIGFAISLLNEARRRAEERANAAERDSRRPRERR